MGRKRKKEKKVECNGVPGEGGGVGPAGGKPDPDRARCQGNIQDI